MPRHQRFDVLIEKYGTAAWETALERLHSGIDTSAGSNACHPWTRSRTSGGYGQINLLIFGGNTTVHKLIYELEIGEVPPGHEVDHTCHNEDMSCPGGNGCYHRPCANITHLEAVPPGENAARAARPRGRGKFKTHCVNNHPYDDENTMWVQQITPSGVTKEMRRCKACNRDRVYKAKNGRERPADAMESISRAGCDTCRRGHAYDTENTKYDSTTGKRRCRKCERLNDLNSKRRKKGLPPLRELPIAS
jgi:hypothetical protein